MPACMHNYDIFLTQDSQCASSPDVPAQDLWSWMEKCTISVEEDMLGNTNNSMVCIHVVPLVDSKLILPLILSSIDIYYFYSSTDSSATAVCNTRLQKAKTSQS